MSCVFRENVNIEKKKKKKKKKRTSMSGWCANIINNKNELIFRWLKYFSMWKA